MANQRRPRHMTAGLAHRATHGNNRMPPRGVRWRRPPCGEGGSTHFWVYKHGLTSVGWRKTPMLLARGTDDRLRHRKCVQTLALNRCITAYDVKNVHLIEYNVYILDLRFGKRPVQRKTSGKDCTHIRVPNAPSRPKTGDAAAEWHRKLYSAMAPDGSIAAGAAPRSTDAKSDRHACRGR